MKKKKILFHSNNSRAYTGFGKNAKNIIKYLYSTGKYEIVEFAAGLNWSNADLQKLPWKAFGTLPDDQNLINELNKDPGLARHVSYGSMNIDKVILQEKPDIYFGVEDIWAFTCCNLFDKPYWNKIHCFVHTTLDSLPILPDAIKYAEKIKNYFVWAKFAETALHNLGHKHVKTLHGAVDIDHFYRLEENKRLELRKKFKIPEKAYVIGFVFRNQLRKSVPNLIEGFKQFLNENPSIDAYLLLHTHWSEGWDIPNLIKEKGLDSKRVLTTYFCRQCFEYEIKPFVGQDLDCPYCGTSKAQITTNVVAGVNETQLNEIYNLMDVYCHPFTSGGQELPIQEAKMAELITLVTNYSCGEESCSPESGGLPLDWAEYREPGTQFIKASTYPSSICKQLKKVYEMKPFTKRGLERKSRQYVLDNYSTEKIGRELEKIFDDLPEIDYNFDFKADLKNPDAIIPDNPDDKEWILSLYREILKIQDPEKGLDDWMSKLKQGVSRQQIHEFFKHVARQENSKNASQPEIKLEELFEIERSEKKLALVLPQSIGDIVIATSLLKSARQLYEGWRIYFITDPKYNEILEPLVPKYIDKLVPFHPQFEQQMWMEGFDSHKGVVDVVKYLHFSTQRQLNYLNNGEDKIGFNINAIN